MTFRHTDLKKLVSGLSWDHFITKELAQYIESTTHRGHKAAWSTMSLLFALVSVRHNGRDGAVHMNKSADMISAFGTSREMFVRLKSHSVVYSAVSMRVL